MADSGTELICALWWEADRDTLQIKYGGNWEKSGNFFDQFILNALTTKNVIHSFEFVSY